MKLEGRVIKRSELTDREIPVMFMLMNEFYDNMSMDVFRKDLDSKDYCLLLTNETGEIVGFTTQKILSFNLDGEMIHGVFSGDTIIHRDYWGSLEMYVVFARFFFEFAKKYDRFYWFLISKGYKTYRILPVFFSEFYPSRGKVVPPLEKAVMDAYASLLYPDEYSPETGVIQYAAAKDKLKDGIADITDKELRNPDIRFFIEANPDYRKGNDLVCLARLDEDSLQPRARGLLFGE
jgi:hypothetical protein